MRLQRWSTTLTLVGLVVMFAAGAWAQRYTGYWFDDAEACAVRGACEDRALLAAAWWAVGVGAVIVVAGVVARWFAAAAPAPGTVESTTGPRARRNVLEALALTAIGSGFIGAMTLILTFGFSLWSIQLGVAVLVACWWGQAHMVRVVGESVCGDALSPRLAWTTGVVASTFAVIAAAGVGLRVDVPANSFGWIVLAWAGAATVVAGASWSVGRVRRPSEGIL